MARTDQPASKRQPYSSPVGAHTTREKSRLGCEVSRVGYRLVHHVWANGQVDRPGLAMASSAAFSWLIIVVGTLLSRHISHLHFITEWPILPPMVACDLQVTGAGRGGGDRLLTQLPAESAMCKTKGSIDQCMLTPTRAGT